MNDLDPGYIGGGGDQVVHQGGTETVALFVVGRMLQQNRSDTLGNSAPNLTVYDLRIYYLAAVLGDQVALESDQTGVNIYLHYGAMGSARPAADSSVIRLV